MRAHDTHPCAGAASRCACPCPRREPPTKAAGAAYSNGAVAAVGETRPVASDAVVPLPRARTDPAGNTRGGFAESFHPFVPVVLCLWLLVGATHLSVDPYASYDSFVELIWRPGSV
jgi:hypothetical protein